jgi:hypothetical protein
MGGCTDGKCSDGKSCTNDVDCEQENFWGGFLWKATGQMEQFAGHESNNYQVNSQVNSQVKSHLSEWANTQPDGPVEEYPKLVSLLGEPIVKANRKNGIAIWYEDEIQDGIHEMLELRDEYVPHCVPANHHDFLTSYVKAYVPPNKLQEVLNVSGSVGYDGLKKLLSARCGSLQANMSTLRTVFDVLNNKRTNYPENIKNRDQIYDFNKDYIREQLRSNSMRWSNELALPYYPGAFPNGCPNN